MSSSVAMRSASSTRSAVTGRGASKRAARLVAQASQQEPETVRAPFATGAAAAAIALALQAAPIDVVQLTPPAQASQAVLNDLSGKAKGAGAELKGSASGAASQVSGAVKGAANQAKGAGEGVGDKIKGALRGASLQSLPSPGALLDDAAGKAKGLTADLKGNVKGAAAQATGNVKGAASNAQGTSQGLGNKLAGIFGKPTLTLPSANDIGASAKGAASEAKGNLKGLSGQAQGNVKGAANQAQGAANGLVNKVKGALSNTPISTLPNADSLGAQAKGAASEAKGNLKGLNAQAQGNVKGAADQAQGAASGLVDKVKGALSGSPVSTLPNAESLGAQAKGAASEAKGNLKGLNGQAQGNIKGAANQAQGAASGLVDKVKGALPISSLPLPGAGISGDKLTLPNGGINIEGTAEATRASLADEGKLGGAGKSAQGAAQNVAEDVKGKGFDLVNKVKDALPSNPLSTVPSSDALVGKAKGALNEAKGNVQGAGNQAGNALKGAADKIDTNTQASSTVERIKNAVTGSPISTLPNADSVGAQAKGAASEAKGNLKGLSGQAEGNLKGLTGQAEGNIKGAANEAKGAASGLVDKVKGALSNSPISTLPGPGGYNNTLSDDIKSTIGDVSRTIRGSEAGKGSVVTDRRNEAPNPGQNLAANAQDAVKPSAAEQVSSFIKNVPISSMPSSNPMAIELEKVKGYGNDAKQAVKNTLGAAPGGNPGVNVGNPAAGAAKDVAAGANSATQNIVDTVKSIVGVQPLTSMPSSNPMASELEKVKGYGNDAKQAVKNTLGAAPGGNPGVNVGNPAAGAAKDVAAGANSATQNVIDSVKSALGVQPLTTLPLPLGAISTNDSAINAENAASTYNPPLAKAGDVDYTKKVADAIKRVPQNAKAAADQAKDTAASALN